jgi:hypothetical protein
LHLVTFKASLPFMSYFVRFHVLTAASMKIVFWDAAPCSLAEVYQRFRGAYSLPHQGEDGPHDGGYKHL